MNKDNASLQELQKAKMIYDDLKAVEVQIQNGGLNALYEFDAGRIKTALKTVMQTLGPYMTDYQEAGGYISEADKQYLRTHGIDVPKE